MAVEDHLVSLTMNPILVIFTIIEMDFRQMTSQSTPGGQLMRAQ